MFVDGKPFKRFHAVGLNTILIDCAMDSHYYRIVTGYRDTVASAEPQPEAHPAVASEKNETFASSSLNGASAVSLLARAMVARVARKDDGTQSMFHCTDIAQTLVKALNLTIEKEIE